MRPVAITALKGGINRLRTKGGASRNQLYDLFNGYITQDGAVNQREGTIRTATLNSNTKGLCAINGIYNVFSTTLQSVPAGYNCNVLVHPTDNTQLLSKIWFAKPFMGFPYVVAQFTDSSIFHYWLQTNGTWKANTVYTNGTIVTPTVPTGLAFEAQRNEVPHPTWSAQRSVAVNDIVEPTTYNGYMFKATAVTGTSPHTGDVEPTWPAVENATVQEFGDFNTSSSAADTSGSSDSTSLGQNITDRYGNSDTVANVGTSGTASTTVAASTTVSTWGPGTTYVPGAVVQPSTNQGAFIGAIPNGDFEAGNDGNWVLGTNWAFDTANMYQGLECVKWQGNHSNSRIVMNTYGTVTPGQSVTVTGYLNPNHTTTDLSMVLVLRWYDNSDVFISETPDVTNASNFVQGHGYRKVTTTGVAPAGATRCRAGIWAGTGTSLSNPGFADLISWDLEKPASISPFLFEAVQATAASSGTAEPIWPTVAGNTVVDGGVTWKAIGTSVITWTALPLMKSGGVEPTWPVDIGVAVADGNMSWKCVNRQVSQAPQAKAVCLGASHVFAGDNDIVPYSAAVDPIDWQTKNNAGYLPTGLNNYGENPVAVLTLYRSNLVVFNAGGYQMWQIDADPANNALLDAQPIGSIYPQAAQSVANDLLFLTLVGVRNLGTVGPTANMQIGSTGQPVDPLVTTQIKAALYEPLAVYYPSRGQYWLIFGSQAFVLTINGNNKKTWSRYVFPDVITDWTLNAERLYLRTAGNLVWKLDEDTVVDDAGGAAVGFVGAIQWPYIDLDSFGINKMMVGIDLVGDGQVTIQFGFNENDKTSFFDNAGFNTSASVTPPYTINSADIVPGTPVPIPLNVPSVSPILIFPAGQAWQWQAANLYVADSSGGGATG